MRQEIKRIMDYFSRRPEVVALYIFGSFDTKAERADSDIDVAVMVSPERRDDFEALKGEYYEASPGFSLKTVDIVILNTAPTYLKHRILKTGRILLDRDPQARKRFLAVALQEYFDYKFIEDICIGKMKERFAKVAHGQ
ncbi:MAG: nucleotidyltransferase domain-containing protein [Nitrospirae bacterium]|nr:nucleotidyltransferase domain-containing protein [Nitrospirota bacterium]